MKPGRKLEFDYAKRLRESGPDERRRLYAEAYSAASTYLTGPDRGAAPEERTAGTSPRLVSLLTQVFEGGGRLLEVGCGRGYACLKLAPHVRSIIGIDVSEPAVREAREVLAQNGISNAEIRLISAFELVRHFPPGAFDDGLSIDVIEHLHAEDARDHMRQVLQVLRPGGRYFIFSPNALTGPHDITREEFPQERRALGFHLHETTYAELVREMRALGYGRFRVLFPVPVPGRGPRPVSLPVWIFRALEAVYRSFFRSIRNATVDRVLAIRLVARAPS